MEVKLFGQTALSNRAYLPWLGLVCVLVVFVGEVARLHPANFFGLTQDDSIYFSSAKALAQEKGYILPSFPGAPAATKYPEFYPWILSWVWRWNPSFPANLTDAVALNVVFGICFITAIFVFLRGLKGVSEYAALIITAFCTLDPQTVFYTGSLLSDIPFAAFALTSIVLAERSAREEGRRSLSSIGSGVFAGLATITRALGAPVALGIVVALALRRRWRQSALFCGGVAPFFAITAWRMLFSPPAVSPVSGAAALSPGWVETWAYYTNYLKIWKLGVPNPSIFAAMLKDNAVSFLRAPAEYFVSRSPGASVLVLSAMLAIVSLVLIKGIARLAARHGVACFHWVLSVYFMTAIFWNYALASRFLILFLPLFAAALWVEGKEILKMVYRGLTRREAPAERGIAAALAMVIFFIAGWSARSLASMWKVAAERSMERASLLPEKREAYAWLASSTQPNARVIAYEDASLYLYSERVAVRPVTFPTVVAYDPQMLTAVLEHTADVARAIRADYWIMSDDDYVFEWREAYLGYQARTREMQSVLPLVYRSRLGHVRIYSLGCIQHPDDSFCLSAERENSSRSTAAVGELRRNDWLYGPKVGQILSLSLLVTDGGTVMSTKGNSPESQLDGQFGKGIFMDVNLSNMSNLWLHREDLANGDVNAYEKMQ